MKKTYSFPTIKVVHLQQPSLMSGSPMTYGNSTEAVSGNLSRRFNGIIDEEDDY